MKHKGVNYDVGFGLGGLVSRPTIDAEVVHRELEIIKNDLHCNAVRISGRDIDRLMLAAEEALKQGLEVWLSPALYDKNDLETLDYIVECARAAETLRKQWPQLVFILGCELTLFMQGIFEGSNVFERLSNPTIRENMIAGAHNKLLNAFLAKTNEAVRQVFQGQVTYASVPFEAVDWNVFDFVCLDHYRATGNKNSYGAQLKPYFAHNKPVIITEVGCCTYQGAEDAGGMGWAIIDQTKTPPQRLDGDYVRDEGLQERELTDLLGILEDSEVDGTFVFTFVSPPLTYNEDPRRDLDMASYSLVKSYAGKHGVSYPDMTWEPKESFKAVADYYSKQ
ncbi:MAG TPA: abortive infection protein [Ktedonobacteraceae bacterium]